MYFVAYSFTRFKSSCVIEKRTSAFFEPVWRGKIHLAIAPTKDMGRIEWMTEKATEVGFDEISFLDCKFSERKTLRADRIEKIVISAVKQSPSTHLPLLDLLKLLLHLFFQT